MLCPASSVLLAAPHHGLTEGIRSLLSTEFDTVVMVADERSLCKSVAGLRPPLAIVDLSLAQGDVSGLLHRLRECLPGLKVILLSAYEEPIVARAAKEAGAEGIVSKRKIANDLLVAVDDVLQGKRHFPA